MGSVPSTPDGTDDPWWPIENLNFSLDHSPLLNVVEMDRQGQNTIAADENCENSEVVHNEENSESLNSECDNLDISKIDETDKTCTADCEIVQKKEQTLEEFKEELRIKREKRQNAIADLRNEITNLRQQLAEEKELNSQLKRDHGCSSSTPTETLEIIANISEALSENVETNQPHRSSITLQRELSNVQLSLQLANSEILSLQAELNVRQKQAETLKEVNTVSKQMIQIREDQLNQLRVKLKDIEDSLAERELSLMSDNLRQEYDRQLTNIRNLRALYEERARVSAAERENLNRQLDTKRAELEAEVEKSTNLTERMVTLETDLQSTLDELKSTKEQLSQFKSENRELHEEMKVINELFSQLLMGFNGGNDIDIDKLSSMLEDNRDLLNDITNREVCKDGAAALPKLLFDLVNQAEENDESKNDVADIDLDNEENQASNSDTKLPVKSNVTTAQEICHNLPKVWKVLIELLNHQKTEQVIFTENGESEDCYNSVQTPTGPKLVLSVSKTYIKLKDLILEKKFLQKETNKLKNLNNHLEQRLNHQEKRLGAVSVELNKTWSLVGKMQRQHRQLHTHEQVLRYQLQQKRRMLNELKEELEYCRRKWALAREKNDESQSQWNVLRLEFSNRKLEDANNSGESGYSDEPVSDDDNSDDESIKVKNIQAIKAELLAPTTKKLLRVHSVSPIRNEGSKKRDSSAPPVSTFLTEAFQTASEIVPTDLTLQESVASKQVENLDLNYAAKSSVVPAKKAAKIIIRNISSEGPSASCSGVKSKYVDAVRPRLSRELRKKATTIKEKKKGEETLEEMFFRLSGQDPPPLEVSEDHESDDDDEFNDIQEANTEQSIECQEIFSQLDSSLAEQNTTNESPNLEEISNIILSEEDEERRIRRAARFQRLEEQCQQLITQVINNSNRGDELNLQLDNVQRRYTPIRENRRSVDKSEEEGAVGNLPEMSLKLETECLSEKEQKYTSRRAERLKRLEEECKAFLSKQNQSKIRAYEMSNKLDELHQRYGSKESPSETGSSENGEEKIKNLSKEEEAILSSRAERLKRLEDQSTELLERMAQSACRASNIESNLDALHANFSDNQANEPCDNFQIGEDYDEGEDYVASENCDMGENCEAGENGSAEEEKVDVQNAEISVSILSENDSSEITDTSIDVTPANTAENEEVLTNGYIESNNPNVINDSN